LKPGRRGGKPATNRLSYGAADLGPFLSVLTSFVTMTKSLQQQDETLGLKMLSLAMQCFKPLRKYGYFNRW
jgi:hypothetical protein